MILGQDRSIEQFVAAWARRELHHAWLLAGPQGVGKATFANAAARRVLAVAAGPQVDLPGLETPDDHPIVRLVEAGSHPDMRWLKRLPKEKGDGLARDITIKQVRALGEFMGMTAALSPWRVAVIDSMDELNKEASNALLKMLEEPPPNTLIFLVSHAPGRLLPTIRSRCRLLHFDPLGDDAMTSILEARSPEQNLLARKRIVEMSQGSVGRALAFADLDLAEIEKSAVAILRQGDPTNARRSQLASELGKKASEERYAAFLQFLPSLIAREARTLKGAPLERALDAYAKTQSSQRSRRESRSIRLRPFFRSADFLPRCTDRLP